MKQSDKKPTSINVYEEQASVDKAVVEKGRVKVIKKVHNEEDKINIDLKNEEVKVERVSINSYVDAPPQVRYEGNTTIIPVVKEVAVVEKKIMLVEEIHITRLIKIVTEERSVPLKKEEITIETSRDK